MAFDLNALPAYYLDKLGLPRVAAILGKSPSLVAMWRSKSKFPLDAVAKLLDFDPAPLEAIKPLSAPPEPGKKLAILVPCTSAPSPKMVDCLMKLYDPREMIYERRAFNNLSVVRAQLAAVFLRTSCDWSYWFDSDMGVPCGDAEWYKSAADLPEMPDAFAKLHAIHRALWHRKTIVSCSYVSKSVPAIPQLGGGSITEIRALIRRGAQDKLIDRPWAGMGGCLIHRKVFEDVIANEGDAIRMKPGGIGDRFNYQYAFFQPIDCETCGDDLPFFIRAARAGHKCFVDLAIQAAHFGERAYTYKDIAA